MQGLEPRAHPGKLKVAHHRCDGWSQDTRPSGTPSSAVDKRHLDNRAVKPFWRAPRTRGRSIVKRLRHPQALIDIRKFAEYRCGSRRSPDSGASCLLYIEARRKAARHRWLPSGAFSPGPTPKEVLPCTPGTRRIDSPSASRSPGHAPLRAGGASASPFRLSTSSDRP